MRCHPLHHLLAPGPGRDGAAGGAGGSELHPHLLRMVSGSGLAVLRPGAPRRRSAAGCCSDGQTAAERRRFNLLNVFLQVTEQDSEGGSRQGLTDVDLFSLGL